MESQNIFWTGNDVILWHHSLCCDAIIGHSCQHFGNAVNIKVGIHFTMQYSYYHLNYHCKIEVYYIFMIFFKAHYERSCQLLLSLSALHLGQHSNKKNLEYFFWIRFTKIRLKNDTLNVFMAFLHIALRKKLSIFYFIERPVHRSV